MPSDLAECFVEGSKSSGSGRSHEGALGHYLPADLKRFAVDLA
jgi:hypothetical protein